MSLSPAQIDERFMQNAIAVAHDATRQNEVPIGAIVVCNGSIIHSAPWVRPDPVRMGGVN